MDRKKRYFATAISNLAAAYDKYRGVYDKSLLRKSTFPDRFFTVAESEVRFALSKSEKLSRKTGLPGDRPVLIETLLNTADLRNDHETGLGAYVLGTEVPVVRLWDPNGSDKQAAWTPWKLEDALAQSLIVASEILHHWEDIRPRSLSWLPIGHACQASCPFCFSKSSVSEDYRGKISKDLNLAGIARRAGELGAERAVITGGGEPTLLNTKQLREGIETLSSELGRTIMITNGHLLGRGRGKYDLECVRGWAEAGLSVLAVSRHAADDQRASALMGLEVNTAGAVEAAAAVGITPRLIAVLQKGGVECEETLSDYLDWAVANGVKEINFKELYVSTALESSWADMEANRFSDRNAVPLSLILDHAERNGWKLASKLPWGAPVFEGRHNGVIIKVAAYTEPSVHWERANGIARSWNIMANGDVLASLEDADSRIDLNGL